MAFVFALIFVPAVAAIGFMLLTAGSGFATLAAVTCFVLLASGMFVGLYKMMKRWEEEPA